MKIRRSHERGETRIDWLQSRHSFSFGSYYDRDWMGYGPLRVINDDVVGPGGGFDPHPHRDMEIISYVRSGALAHRDSMGHESAVPAG
jgi:redox-sensitive bicupin YhaK (pirin superfamily)